MIQLQLRIGGRNLALTFPDGEIKKDDKISMDVKAVYDIPNDDPNLIPWVFGWEKVEAHPKGTEEESGRGRGREKG